MGDTNTLTTESALTSTASNMTGMFNISHTERMAYLDYLDNQKWPYIYPVIIYLLILMLIGFIGNSIVVIVYFNKFKPSTTRLFILTLATFDLLTCTLSIPGVIVELRFHYTFFFPALCRIFRASRMYFVLVSMFTLVIVAVDRYRKVCRPLKPQYTIRSAGRSLLGTNLVALALTIFGAVVGGRRTVPTDRDDITGSNCSYDDEFIGKPITKVYSSTLFLLFIICVGILIVLYSLIGRTVYKHRSFRFQAKPVSSSGSSQTTTSTSLQCETMPTPHKYVVTTEPDPSSGYSSDNESKRADSFLNKNMLSVKLSTMSTASSTASIVPKAKPKKADNQKRSTSKTTLTLFIITLVFILSFLPFLILVALWGSNWQFVNSLQGYTFTLYKLFFHSYHVNNVVNCYIYSFCNPRFRTAFKQLFTADRTKH